MLLVASMVFLVIVSECTNKHRLLCGVFKVERERMIDYIQFPRLLRISVIAFQTFKFFLIVNIVVATLRIQYFNTVANIIYSWQQLPTATVSCHIFNPSGAHQPTASFGSSTEKLRV